MEKCANAVKAEYEKRSDKCDKDSAENTSGTGSFRTELAFFDGITIFSRTIGAFGEVNMGYDKFLQKFARKAAAKQEGLSHSLLAPSRCRIRETIRQM